MSQSDPPRKVDPALTLQNEVNIYETAFKLAADNVLHILLSSRWYAMDVLVLA